MKPKILFALNYRRFEEALEKKLKNQFDFVGSASYREVVVDKVRQTNPDIILMREAIPGTKGILDIIYTIRNTHKNVRIVFMTGRREPGDLLLADLVSYGVYDIITSESIPMKEVTQLIRQAQSFDDVSHLLPKPNRDESKPGKSFDVQTRVVEKEGAKMVEPVPEKKPEKTHDIRQPAEREPEPVLEVAPKPVTLTVPEPIMPPVPEPVTLTVPDLEPEPEPEPEPLAIPEPSRPPLDEALVIPEKKGGRLRGKLKKAKEELPVPTPGLLALPPAPSETMTVPPIPQAVSVKKNNVVQSKQIISFIGAVNGVGNTQLAFNAAVKLAQDGFRVLFVELNPNFSTIDTSYQLGDYQRGLEKALKALENGQPRDVEKSIIRMDTIQQTIKSTNAMSKNYKRMPQSLDFLLFSQDYQTLVYKPIVDYTQLKDLAMILLLQENYDYVVIDSEPLGKRPEMIQDLCSISGKIYVTLNQETAQIGHVTRHVMELNKRIKIEEKLYYILNKEVQSQCDRTMIEEWLDTPLTVSIPDANHAFVEANFLGIPFVLHSTDEAAQRAFETLKQSIQHK